MIGKKLWSSIKNAATTRTRREREDESLAGGPGLTQDRNERKARLTIAIENNNNNNNKRFQVIIVGGQQ
jgi:hypothetical protein